MYIPASFRQEDGPTLTEFIHRHSFGLLISQTNAEPFATHVPMLFSPETGEHGCLHGHLARANPQWKNLAGQQVLAVFSGPHAYVSPTWYGTSPAVPTWNYLAVHVYGVCELVEDDEQLLGVLKRSAEIYEQSNETPWSFGAEDPFVRKLLKEIVGFRVVVERVEGKWKLGQNHSAEMRSNVSAQLAKRSDADSQAIAALMAGTLTADG